MRLLRAFAALLFAGILSSPLGASAAPAETPAGGEEDFAIAASQLGENRWELTLTLPAWNVDYREMQRLLMPMAAKLCGDLTPRLDAFKQEGRFAPGRPGEAEEGSEKPDYGTRLVQVVACEPAPTRMPTPNRALTDARRAALEDEIRAKTLAYFKGLDAGGDAGASYAMLSEYLRSDPFDDWRRARLAERTEKGDVIERRVWRMTVYVDPPDAPTPGIYVAADYEAAYENALFECGFFDVAG